MLNRNKLMSYLLTLLVSFVITACGDSDCDTGTAGSEAGGSEEMGGAEADEACEAAAGETSAGETPAGETPAGETPAGETPAGETPVVEYNFVVVKDTSTDINDDGTPGADICEVGITCGGTAINNVNLSNNQGSSPDCASAADKDNCVCAGATISGLCGGTNRADVSHIWDNVDTCEDDDYISVGIDGYVALEVTGQTLSECESVGVTVTEKDGPNNESYIVGLCTSLANLDFSEMVMGDSCLIIGSAESSGTQSFSWSPN